MFSVRELRVLGSLISVLVFGAATVVAVPPTSVHAQSVRVPPAPGLTPGQLAALVPKTRVVDAQLFACRSARFNAAFARSIVPLWDSLGIDRSATARVVDASDAFSRAACGTDPDAAQTALNDVFSASKGLSGAYARQVGIKTSEARQVLGRAQMAAFAMALSCNGSAKAVGEYLLGGSSGPINIFGGAVSGGASGSIYGVGASAFSACGGGGGGGGGGGSSGPLIATALDGSSFAKCMGRPETTNSCGYYGQDPDAKDETKQDEAEVVAEKNEDAVVLRDSKGNKIEIQRKANDTTAKWVGVAAGVAGIVGGTATLILAGPAAGTAVLVWGGVQLVAGIVQLGLSVYDIAGTPPYEYVIVPKYVCPVDVGGNLAWWPGTGPGGQLTTSDVYSVCTCNGATGSQPARCQSRAQRELGSTVSCANPVADAPVDACVNKISDFNPWLSIDQSRDAVCESVDCGPSAVGEYTAGTCSCAAPNTGGALTPPPWVNIINPIPN